MKRAHRRIREVPFFPLVPFVPLVLVGGLLALSTITMIGVRRLLRSMEQLLPPGQEDQPAL